MHYINFQSFTAFTPAAIAASYSIMHCTTVKQKFYDNSTHILILICDLFFTNKQEHKHTHT